MLYVIATCKPLFIYLFIISFLKIYQNIGKKLGSNMYCESNSLTDCMA
jgi:hypothetical protein